MPGPKAAEVVLTDDERSQLRAWARRPTGAQALATWSRIVLAAAEGGSTVGIAARLCLAGERW